MTQIPLTDIALAIRALSIDAIDAANSGHPGLPLGCAEIGAYLFGQALQYTSKDPQWINRDRFVLSAGHGSMLQYACLHLAGYNLSLDDIKGFRQLHRPTAGHPEYRDCPGVETTTGPLGQGLATGIGMALGQKITQAHCNIPADLWNHHVVILAGDGCLMEGISSEASSLAGHLQLDNVIVIYDANDICLDGPITECFTEDVAKRYDAYGWHVQQIDGHDLQAIDHAYQQAKAQNKPALIIAKTIIGKGSPNRQGTSEAHGKALGESESKLTKAALGIPEEPKFYIPSSVTDYFKTYQHTLEKNKQDWQIRWDNWLKNTPESAKKWAAFNQEPISETIKTALFDLSIAESATRQSSNAVLQYLHDHVPNLIGGSADLSCSDSTLMKQGGIIAPNHFNARNIKYGVREFAMGAMASGLVLQGNLRTFCGTFLTFSDYMRNAIRLAALMKLNVIYQFTHDSFFLGEDGPTHQPIEHLAALRAIPQLTVIRPADVNEVKGAWWTALHQNGPVALILSRQKLPNLANTHAEKVKKGAYIISGSESGMVDYVLLATGSEVHLALQVAEKLEEQNKTVRVVSFPSFELFDQQDQAYQDSILEQAKKRVSIEAQTAFGWHKYIGRDGIAISIDHFGLSAPDKDLAKEFGFTVEMILKNIL